MEKGNGIFRTCLNNFDGMHGKLLNEDNYVN